MLVRATRTVSALTLRVAFYGGLFLLVVVAQVAITTALRTLGWSGGASLAVSGCAVLAIVLSGVRVGEIVGERRAAAREIERLRQGLPSGPCCVVWRGREGEADMPWTLVRPLQVRYPALGRRLSVEGVAVVEFEIGSDGVAKHMHCLDVWPSPVFYEAARAALAAARFEPRKNAQVRFGASYHMAFVFRMAGATRRRGKAKSAPAPLRAATQPIEPLQRRA
ncbi:MAG TPA: TonB family protein [Caulobacterales bacterium]|nr:TonB family protein [Caulobacterales bacterium]